MSRSVGRGKMKRGLEEAAVVGWGRRSALWWRRGAEVQTLGLLAGRGDLSAPPPGWRGPGLPVPSPVRLPGPVRQSSHPLAALITTFFSELGRAAATRRIGAVPCSVARHLTLSSIVSASFRSRLDPPLRSDPLPVPFSQSRVQLPTGSGTWLDLPPAPSYTSCSPPRPPPSGPPSLSH